MCDGYNGHASWEHWDVSSTIANNEYLYLVACEYAKKYGATETAAKQFIEQELEPLGVARAFGGSEFTVSRVWAALEEYEDGD